MVEQASRASSETPAFRVSRRNFLRSAGAGVALAGTGAIPFRASRAFAQGAWDQTADIVVVGTGAAALSAAATAHSLGNSVIVLEKATVTGGTSAKSGGVYWIPNNSLMNAEGITDPKQDAIAYMARLAFPDLFDPDNPTFGLPEHEHSLIEAFYDNGPAAVDHLGEIGALKSTLNLAADGQPFPDYFAELEVNKAPRGRGLAPELPDQPGVGGAGAELIRQLQAYCEANSVPILLEHRVTAVVRNDNGEIVGIEATAASSAATPTAEQRMVAIQARKGVIFGSGGYTHNLDRRINFLRGPIFGGCAVPTNEGDLITIAQAIGADFGNMRNAYFAEVVVEQALAFSSVPSDVFIVWGDSMIMVDSRGQRIMNEKKVYNERTQVHWTWDPVKAAWPNLVVFMIYDQRVADTAGGFYPVPAAGVDTPYLITGQTWEELAANIDDRLAGLVGQTTGIRLDPAFAENLAATVQRYNGFANAGKDDDFHRGETPVEVAFDLAISGGDNGKPNSTMYPLADTGPYYAIIIGPGTLDTKGGPKVNTKAQVLDTEGNPIPGLYAAGNCAQACSGQAYWAAGGTLGPAVTTGYVAAMTANDEPAKEA
jgi:succinate dehydrogenase/fumarate reductase flavoprotein subunit